jgi:hypothetical protein
MRQMSSVFGALLLGATLVAGQLALPRPAAAQSSQKPSPDTVRGTIAGVDPAKEADIRRLLDAVGTKALVTQTMSEMMKSIRPVLSNSLPPGDYRGKLVDLFFARFAAKADPQSVLDLAIPSYDKNFTHDEIRGLIAFYQTPLGKKSVSVLPQLVAEVQEKGKKWGEGLGRQCMTEVLAEHPEFEKQIEEAQKAAQTKN